jgi:hypothetical protein
MVQTAILSGLNANTMQNGVVAYLNVKLATGFSGSAPIAISGTLGATADGNAITIGGVNGGVSKGTVVNAHNITAHSSQSGGMPARAVGSPTDLKLDPLTLTPEIRRAECSSERLQEIGDKAICTLTFNSQFIGAEKIILEPYISHGSALEIEPKELVIVPGTESVDFTATLKRRLLPEEEVFSIGVKAPRGDVIQIFVWIGHEKPK